MMAIITGVIIMRKSRPRFSASADLPNKLVIKAPDEIPIRFINSYLVVL